MLLLLICIAAGVLTILAPCVLPLLPVIIGSSITGGKKQRSRPYIIAASLALSIIGFTLILKVSTALINLSPSVLNYVSGTIIILLGFASLIPGAWERLIIRLNWQAASQRFLGKGENNAGTYIGPILVGVALGPVFSSCSPTYAFILATVLPHSFASGLIYLVAYSLALVATLLGVSLAGRRSIASKQWIVNTHSPFRRALGIVFIVIGLVIFSGNIVKVETSIANHLPFDETRIERLLLASQTKPIAKKTAATASSVLNVVPTPAPQFQGLTNWINSKPLKVSGLRGKVVLVDFWTYSCVNCNRALPNVEKWATTYAKDGLVVVGVHTPEFAFEHNPANVANFVKNFGLTYPIALDNNYDTWNAFDNDSWPADYLIDKSGDIRYVSLGEGGYNVTEEAIQQLLGIKQPLTTPDSVVPVSQNQSPETYFGTNRDSDYAGTPALADGSNSFTSKTNLSKNGWSLGGTWTIAPENITSNGATNTLTYRAEAKDIYVVAGTTNGQPASVGVNLPASVAGQYGADAPNGVATISGSRLYHLVSLKQFGDTTITLTVPANVQLYTFTFGS